MAADDHILLMSGNFKKSWISTPASMNASALTLEFQAYPYKK